MIISRYLLFQYLKVLFFCVLSFLAILITTRLQDIAYFASLGAPASAIFWFALYQVPYVLPLSVPIACLISSTVLIQRLSASHELTALRAMGKSLGSVLAPILWASALVAVLNFYVVSELATQSHLASRILEKELQEINPLVLLHKNRLSRLRGVYVHAKNTTKASESAHEVVFATWNKSANRMNVLLAQELTAKPPVITGKNLTLITGLSDSSPDTFGSIAVENVREIKGSLGDLTLFLRKGSGRFHIDYLRTSLLFVHIQKKWQAMQGEKSSQTIRAAKKQFSQGVAELSRRLSLSIAAVTFTLMGVAFGLQIGRQSKQKRVYSVIALTTLYLVCFFLAKGYAGYFILASALYLLPHAVITAASVFTLNRASRGVET